MTFGKFAVMAIILSVILLWMNRKRIIAIRMNKPSMPSWVSELHLNVVFLGVLGFVFIHLAMHQLWPDWWNAWWAQDGFILWQVGCFFALWLVSQKQKFVVWIGRVLVFLCIMGFGRTIHGALDVSKINVPTVANPGIFTKVTEWFAHQQTPPDKVDAPVEPNWATVDFREEYETSFSWPNNRSIRISVTRWVGKDQKRVILPEEKPITITGDQSFYLGVRIDHIRIQSTSKETVPVSFNWRKK